MTFADDIADDQNFADDIEAVTLRTIRDGGTEATFTITNARRLPLRRNEDQFAGVQINSDSIRWLLKDNEVTATVPTTVVREGDIIIVASPSEKWEVTQASLETWDTIWSCVCVKK